METSVPVLPQPVRYQRVAAPLHTVLLIAAQAGLLLLSRFRGHHPHAAMPSSHAALYGRTMVIEWLLFGFMLLGVWLAGSPFSTVLGDRWRSLRQFLQDLGLAVLFLMVTIPLDSVIGSLMHSNAPNQAVQAMLPQGAADLWLWLALSLSAGICEEAIYRGYLQRQMMALTQSAPAGIVLSATAFGAAHLYQGTGHAVQIGILGVMGGILAHWRRSVRPGMIAHTLQDVLGGLVRH